MEMGSKQKGTFITILLGDVACLLKNFSAGAQNPRIEY